MSMTDILKLNKKFDFIYSSLAFHYIKDFESFAEIMYEVLNAGGYLLFSQEHPIITATVDGKGHFNKDENGNRIDSLQGRLDSFRAMEFDSIAVKRADDGKMIGAKVNGGRTSSDNYAGKNDDHWIETAVNGNTNTFTIKHKFDEDKSNHQEINDKDSDNDTTSSINLNDNGGSNTFDINTPIVDSMGHTVGKNVETITLPFGFKTINVDNDTTESAAPAQTGINGETADNTQDSLIFTPTNKWIKMVATGNNEIKFGHELSGIDAKEHSSSDINIENFGDTFNILKFTTDKAGHITEVGEESV
jgi:hypothetical protein